MLSSATTKLAKKTGLTIKNGIAYGNIGGYYLTCFDEDNALKIHISAIFPPSSFDMMKSHFLSKEIKKQLRLLTISYEGHASLFVLSGGMGLEKRATAFLDTFPAKFDELGVQGSTHCVLCGEETNETSALALVNGIAHYAHGDCLQQLEDEAAIAEEAYVEQKKHIGRGVIGAIIGALIGSIPWIIVYQMGYFVAWFGLLIGFGAKKGYELLGGKPCKPKRWIVLVVTTITVCIATIVSFAVGVLIELGAAPNLFFSAVEFVIALAMEDTQFLGYFLRDLGLGLLFGLLGVMALIRGMRDEHREGIAQVERL